MTCFYAEERDQNSLLIALTCSHQERSRMKLRSVAIAKDKDSMKQATCCGTRCEYSQPAAVAAIATAVRRSMMQVQEVGLLVWAENVNHGCEFMGCSCRVCSQSTPKSFPSPFTDENLQQRNKNGDTLSSHMFHFIKVICFTYDN